MIQGCSEFNRVVPVPYAIGQENFAEIRPQSFEFTAVSCPIDSGLFRAPAAHAVAGTAEIANEWGNIVRLAYPLSQWSKP